MPEIVLLMRLVLEFIHIESCSAIDLIEPRQQPNQRCEMGHSNSNFFSQRDRQETPQPEPNNLNESTVKNICQWNTTIVGIAVNERSFYVNEGVDDQKP